MKGETLRKITLCYSYYENPQMLKRQCEHLRSLPESLKRFLRLIVVDDGTGAPKASDDGTLLYAQPGSGLNRAKWRNLGFPFELYRMKLDIRWNQHACRNLAVSRARTRWVMLTDMDHLVPEETLRALTSYRFDPRNAYRFHRMIQLSDDFVRPYHPHPNSWFLTRHNYWEMGGYDERLRGRYGTDGDFRRRLRKTIGKPIELEWPLYFVTRLVVPDAVTLSYSRRDPRLDGDVQRLIAKRNRQCGWKPLHFLTPWLQVK